MVHQMSSFDDPCDIMSTNMVCVDIFISIPNLKVHVGNNFLSSQL